MTHKEDPHTHYMQHGLPEKTQQIRHSITQILSLFGVVILVTPVETYSGDAPLLLWDACEAERRLGLGAFGGNPLLVVARAKLPCRHEPVRGSGRASRRSRCPGVYEAASAARNSTACLVSSR